MFDASTPERALAVLQKHIAHNKLALYRPYDKQLEFHALAATHREVAMLGANQSGKSWSLAMELSIHALGQYPDWWQGRRFNKPVVIWAGGVTGEQTRDSIQKHILGRPGQEGTGGLPHHSIESWTAARGCSGLADTILVRRPDGGLSQIRMLTYARGREPWQGESCDVVAFDEEPPLDIYMEGLTRTNATGGIILAAFTPLLGMSDVVHRFLTEDNPDRAHVRLTIWDARHIPAELRETILRSYSEHDRRARAEGLPHLGSGRVFPMSADSISCKAFPIPSHWAQLGAMDFGWDHPFAAVRLAHDRDEDKVYVTHVYRKREATPLQHCEVLKAWGKWLPWAWPHDGLQHDKGSGKQLKAIYQDHGLAMASEKATFSDGTYGFEAGITRMIERFEAGTLKVFDHLHDFFDEFEIYHRKDGVVVKERDDILSATRIGLMSIRMAMTKPKSRPARHGFDNWMTHASSWAN